MIRSALHFLYGSAPAEFKSAFGLSESIARLQAATRRSAFRVLAAQSAAGPVGESRVRLQRVIPMVGNSFKPFFLGRFETRGEGVYLTGRFTMLGFVKAFMTVWLVGVLTVGIAFAITAVSIRRADWLPALGGLGMFGAGVALVALGKWFARNDIAWLSNVIRTALDASVVVQAPPGQGPELSGRPVWKPDSVSSLPTVLRVTALVLFVVGAMELWSAVSGISSWHASPGHTTVTRFSSWPMRLTIGAYGIWTLVIALGVYRRRQWAWRLGLVYLGAAGLTSISQAVTSSQLPEGWILRVIVCVLSLAVTLYWGWWWYAQRVHFRTDGDLLPKEPEQP